MAGAATTSPPGGAARGGGAARRPAPAPPALVAFALLWGQLQAAHVLKEWASLRALEPLPVLALLLMLPAAAWPTAAPALPLAALSSGAYLLLKGSRSNHVVQDALINLAIVLTAAPWGTADDRRLRRLGAVLHYHLIALYAVSGLHKLNWDFLDAHVSCASGVTATLLSQYVPTLLPADGAAAAFLVWVAPYAALVMEAGLPALLLYAGPPGRGQRRRGGEFCRRAAVAIGALFHLVLALPLPPGSYYPFSVSCLAIYILQVPDAVAAGAAAAYRLAPDLSRTFWLMLPACCVALPAAANAAGSWASWVRAGQGSEAPFEYPPYNLYDAGICWCFVVAALLVVLALMSPGSGHRAGPTRPAGESVVGAAAACLGVLLAIGLSPYLGLRTYPAFAMFSNLRVEGSNPNHVLLGGGWDLFGLQRDAVEVLATDSPAVLGFQVDLAVLYTPSTTRYLVAAGVEPALWICPPAWPHALPSNFTPFSVPTIELHRRLAHEELTGRRHTTQVSRAGRTFTVHGAADLPIVCPGWTPEWLCEAAKRWAGPFRSFDERAGPCRH